MSLHLLVLDGSREGGLNVGSRGSDEELVFTLGDNPCRGCLVERSQLVGGDAQCEGLVLARLQTLCLGESLQLLGGLVGSLRVGSSNVEFYDLLALAVTCVLNGDGHVVDVVLLFNLGVAILEGGVAQAITEGIRNGDIEGVEVTIANVDVLLIFGIVHVADVALLALVEHVDAWVFVDGEVLR